MEAGFLFTIAKNMKIWTKNENFDELRGEKLY